MVIALQRELDGDMTMYVGRTKKICLGDSLDEDGELEISIDGNREETYCEWLTKQDAEVLIEQLKNTFGI